MGATYTRQSSYADGDVITAAHTNDEFNQLLAAFQASTGHTHDGTANEGGPITKLLGTSITIGDATSGTDITVTFDGESNDGVLKWMEDEDYFEFSDDILVASTEKIQFRDTAIYINSSTDGQLDLVADTEIQIAATTVDINGNVDVSGTLTVAGAVDFGDAALSNVGAVQLDSIAGDGDTNTSITFSGSDVITVATGGTTSFTVDASQNILMSAAKKVQFRDTALTINSSTDGQMDIDADTELEITAPTVDINASTAVLVSNDLKLDSDAAVLGFGADNDVTLTHVEDTGLLLNGTMALQFNDASQSINAPSATVLDINATDEIELNATLVDANANLDVSGTYTGGGLMTTGGNIVIPDSGNIGSASDTDAIAIASNGQVTLTQTLIGTALDISGDIDVDGTTNLDVVDIDGAVDMASTLAVAGVVTANAGVVVDNITIDGNTITTTDTNGHLVLTANGTGNVQVNSDTLIVTGTEGEAAAISLQADEADDNADVWKFKANTDSTLDILQQISGSEVAHLTFTPNATVANSTVDLIGHVNVGHDLDVTGTVTANGLTVDGDAVFTTEDTIRLNTSDGSDNGTLAITAGGANSDARGARVRLYGNEHASLSGVLDIGAGNVSGGHIYNYTNAKLRHKIDYNGDISFYEDTGTTAKFFWDSSAESLGIGDTSPENILHVKGAANTSTTVQIESATSGYSPKILFDGIVGSAADNLLGEVGASWDTHTNKVAAIRFESGSDTTNKDDGLISFWTSDAGSTLDERMRIDSSGNVGIGTSLPDKAIHLKTAVNNTAVVRIESTATDSYPTLSLKNDAREYQLTAHGPLGDKFTIYDGTAGSHRLVIDSSGNVGINTDSPSAALEIGSTTTIAGARLTTSAGSDSEIEFINTNSGNHTWAIGQDFSNSNAFTIAYSNAVGASLSSNSKVVIDSSGNVDVTGSVTANEFLFETGTGNNAGTMISTDGTILYSMVDSGGSSQFRNVSGAYSIRTGGDAGATSNTKERATFASNGDISFYEDTGTTAKFFWDASTERLGIGNAAPNTTLDITTTSNTNGFLLDVIGTAPNYMFDVRDDGTSKFRIDESGNVGIGTDSPSAVIDARQTSTGGSSAIRVYNTDNSNTTTQTAALFLSPDSRGTGALIFAEKENADFSTSAGRDVSLVFSPVLNNTQTERMYITSAGNVGIGTNSPNLHGFTTAVTLNTSSNGGYEIGQSGTKYGAFALQGDGRIQLTNFTANPLTFQTNNEERMRIDSSGNVGIGEIPQTDLNTAYDHLQIGKPANIMGSDTSGGLWLNSGAFFNSAGNWEYLLSSETVSSLTMTNSIPFRFRYAAAGTAGNTFSWSEAARIDDSGNLLVGTTSNSVYNDSSGTGIALNTGQIQIAGTGTPLYVNRQGSDGNLVDFRKDGGAVGSIGSLNSGEDFYINSNDDLNLQAGGNTALAIFQSSGSLQNITVYTHLLPSGTNDIGASGGQWRNLYLSGDVITGGGGTSSTGEIQFVADSTRARIVGGYDSGGGGYIAFRTDTTGGTDLERARFNNAGNLAFTNGNGIDFSATSGTGTSELLDDYEEGTFTATLSSGATTTPTTDGTYTKIGNRVYISLNAFFNSITVNGTALQITGLPFTNNGEGADAFASCSQRVNFDSSKIQYWNLANGTTTLNLKQATSNTNSVSDVLSEASGTYTPTFGNINFHYTT